MSGFVRERFRCCRGCERYAEDCYKTCKAFKLENRLFLAKQRQIKKAKKKEQELNNFFSSVATNGIKNRERIRQRERYQKYKKSR